ncbi:cation diffusion facilitator family transporter [Burkholderia sp. Ac-20379]|uniref:cation diffusion facilitator family transporter n=1 Tax=Burkholderia sp. Ac-20379 TaxID=2703900 RepID=UPI0019809B97|nr:cation diffusion facilitator family transporter [Burkholderia sp. Ac-20379]MBN3727232.1 cation diffusion facilitator family transporter [Burkholderia sp. Ac-20379]
MPSSARASQSVHAITSRVLTTSLVVNLVLMAAQAGAAYAAHSSGIFADTVHAAVDLIADALLLVACRLDAKLPPEQRPTYEPFALFGLGALLLATGAQMVWSATTDLGAPSDVTPDALSFAVLAIALAGKETLSRWMLRRARAIGGAALIEASAWHIRTDALTLLVATLALAGARAGLPRLDELAATLIGAMIVRTGYLFAKRGYQLRAEQTGGVYRAESR